MTHSVIDKDGMRVLVVSDMNKLFDPETGLELKRRAVDNLEIVHSTEIARYYGLDHNDVGFGDSKVMGVWNYVYGNLIGTRVPYNTDEEVPAERFVRAWEILKDGQGRPYDTKEKVVGQKFLKNADNGMYVRHSDLVKFAKAQGWKKDGGWPVKNQAAGGLDIAAIVAAVMAAMQANQPQPAPVALTPETPATATVEPKTRSSSQRAHDAWLKAGRPEPKDGWKADWIVANG